MTGRSVTAQPQHVFTRSRGWRVWWRLSLPRLLSYFRQTG